MTEPGTIDEGRSQLGRNAITIGVWAAALLVALRHFGFILILWILLTAAVIAGLICVAAAAAAARKHKHTRNTWLIGAGLAAVVASSLWKWTDAWQIEIPSLSTVADAREVTAAYRDRVAHIQTAYSGTERGLLWPETVTGGASGSGILLANDRSRGVILTNRHLVDPTYQAYRSNVPSSVRALAVRTKLASENDWHPSRLAAIHRELDMALVIIEHPFRNRGTVRLANHLQIQQGEPVVALGNPLGLEFVTTEGIVSKVGIDAIITSCPISPGNSGGPLILKRKGLVAGLNTASRLDAQNMNFAVLAQWAVSPYPPAPPDKRTSNKILGTVEGPASWSSSASSSNLDCWHWLSDREAVLELLRMVYLEDSR